MEPAAARAAFAGRTPVLPPAARHARGTHADVRFHAPFRGYGTREGAGGRPAVSSTMLLVTTAPASSKVKTCSE